jgi:hypothetical protein
VELSVPEAKNTKEKTIRHKKIKPAVFIFLRLKIVYIKKGILYRIENAVMFTFAAKPKK